MRRVLVIVLHARARRAPLVRRLRLVVERQAQLEQVAQPLRRVAQRVPELVARVGCDRERRVALDAQALQRAELLELGAEHEQRLLAERIVREVEGLEPAAAREEHLDREARLVGQEVAAEVDVAQRGQPLELVRERLEVGVVEHHALQRKRLRDRHLPPHVRVVQLVEQLPRAQPRRRAVRRPLDEALVALGQRALEPLVALAPLLSLVLRGFELELAELALLLEKTGDRVEERHEVVVHGLIHRGKLIFDHSMDQYTAAQEKQSQG